VGFAPLYPPYITTLLHYFGAGIPNLRLGTRKKSLLIFNPCPGLIGACSSEYGTNQYETDYAYFHFIRFIVPTLYCLPGFEFDLAGFVFNLPGLFSLNQNLPGLPLPDKTKLSIY